MSRSSSNSSGWGWSGWSACVLLGDPQERLRVIHVAGTNGKGSVSAFIDAALRAAGLRAGLFSSPELERVNERIAVDGQEIGTAELVALLARIRPAVEEAMELGDAPSRFEMFMHAFLHFVKQGCAIMPPCWKRKRRAADRPTSARGRWSTVITPVALDHQAYLGIRWRASPRKGRHHRRAFRWRSARCSRRRRWRSSRPFAKKKRCKLDTHPRRGYTSSSGRTGFSSGWRHGDGRDARLGLAGRTSRERGRCADAGLAARRAA